MSGLFWIVVTGLGVWAAITAANLWLDAVLRWYDGPARRGAVPPAHVRAFERLDEWMTR